MIFERFSAGAVPLLRASDRAARELVTHLVSGEPIELEVLHPRDAFEERKIFAQIAEVANALGMLPEQLRAELLFEAGYYTPVGVMFGMQVIALHSMSRRKMSDRKFHKFWDDARQVMAQRMLPRIQDDAERMRLARQLSLRET